MQSTYEQQKEQAIRNTPNTAFSAVVFDVFHSANE
jgi:hypothetical protein